MHIPDGIMSNPVMAATGAASAAALGISLYKANRELEEKMVPLMAVTGAFVFAAQMLNFPIGGGTSGHFLGAAFVAILMGPWISFIVISSVLVIQCFGFGDGGVIALGANIFNMGVIGSFGSYLIYSAINKALPKNAAIRTASVFIAAMFSVVLAASACAVELALSDKVPLQIGLPVMAGIHAIIGIGEGLITVAAVSLVFSVKGDTRKQMLDAMQTAE